MAGEHIQVTAMDGGWWPMVSQTWGWDVMEQAKRDQISQDLLESL